MGPEPGLYGHGKYLTRFGSLEQKMVSFEPKLVKDLIVLVRHPFEPFSVQFEPEAFRLGSIMLSPKNNALGKYVY